MASGGAPTPSLPRSRSRKVRTNAFRHAKLSRSDSARKDKGNPPRFHRSFCADDPVSSSSNPCISTNSTRPARVSEAPDTNSGLALPRMTNFAGSGFRSASTRKSRNKSGRNWISSSTTKPRRGSNASRAALNRARSRSSSRSYQCTFPPPPVNCRAAVVFPACRGPSNATTRLRPRASPTADKSRFLSFSIPEKLPSRFRFSSLITL